MSLSGAFAGYPFGESGEISLRTGAGGGFSGGVSIETGDSGRGME